MFLFIISFLAGVLTVLAPCVLPLLPIIIGGSVGSVHRLRPYIIALSLALSIVLFTLLLKGTTAFITIPETFWKVFSGSIIIVLGITSIFPELWTRLSTKLSLGKNSEEALAKAGTHQNMWGAVLVGAALGPVFSSCSPTYFLILATVLPASFATGLLYLSAYACGLAAMLLAIGLLGRKLINKISFAADPKGKFRRGLGVLFILVGLSILTGFDKKISTSLLDNGYFDITAVETYFLNKKESAGEMCVDGACTTTPGVIAQKNLGPYKEITAPSGFINSEPFTLKEYIGKKVILVDFMTYSCINCVRTFPYLKAWDEKYRDDGLLIIGIHTPEFAFEKEKKNVEGALKKHGLSFPVVLDNEYGTWRAYENNYWPRKYIIDISGNIVYDHIGEGEYVETEQVIQQLLKERLSRLGQTSDMSEDMVTPESEAISRPRSPETYFGFYRLEQLGNGDVKQNTVMHFTDPKKYEKDTPYLVGDWIIRGEYAEAISVNAKIIYRYGAKDVFMVANQADGKPNPFEVRENGKYSSEGVVQADDLYPVLHHEQNHEGLLEIRFTQPGVQVYTFTFG